MPLLGSEEAGLGSVLTAAGGASSSSSSGDPGVVGKFTGTIFPTDAGATFTYMADPGQLGPTIAANETSPQLYPTSARTIQTLRAVAKTGTGGSGYTLTLYKNGAPTAMTVTFPNTTAPGTELVDSAHPQTFAAGDTFDVRIDVAATDDGSSAYTVVLEGPAGGGGGGGGGDFPGFGSAPPAIAGASSEGVLDLASRSDHTHQGATAVNGQVGNVFAPLPVSGIATGATQLSTLASAGFGDGAAVKVATVNAIFRLQQSALTVDGITVVAATGKSGWQWVRQLGGDTISAAQTTWSINNSTGNDENSGVDDAHPLKTRQELARRWWGQQIASATVRILANVPAADKPLWNIYPTGRVTFAGVATSTIYTSTVTSYHQAATLTDSNQLVDAAVPGGSFTAAGAMADGVQFVAPNSLTYWWGAKDLGSDTLRISSPTLLGISAQNPTAAEPYSAVTLPQIAGGASNEVWFTTPIANNNIRYQDLYFTAVGSFPGFQFWRCAVANGGNLFEGGLWSGSAVFSTLATNTVTRPSTTQAAWQFSLFRNTGAFVAHIVTGGESIFDETTFQGCGLTPQSGSFCNVLGKLYAYDCTGNCLEALYWSTVLFQSGSTFVGAGNSGVLWSARQWSMITYSAAAASVISAASTSAGNGVSSGGTATTVASLPINIGPGGQGIFQTDVAGSFT